MTITVSGGSTGGDASPPEMRLGGHDMKCPPQIFGYNSLNRRILRCISHFILKRQGGCYRERKNENGVIVVQNCKKIVIVKKLGIEIEGGVLSVTKLGECFRNKP